MRVLVDTSVWIDYFDGVVTPRTDYLDEILGWGPVHVADLIVGEVLQGFPDDKHWERARQALGKFPSFLIEGSALVMQSAVHQRVLRGKGASLPGLVDCLIATFCIQNNLALLHSDPAFEPFERYLGLKLPDPGSPFTTP
jgi:predicted nucleic acid-binding protein